MPEYMMLEPGECYLFNNTEDDRPRLTLEIIEDIVEKANPLIHGDSDHYRGFYFLKGFGWDKVKRQSIKIRTDNMKMICTLDEIESHMNPKINEFIKKAISSIFTTHIDFKF